MALLTLVAMGQEGEGGMRKEVFPSSGDTGATSREAGLDLGSGR